MSYTRPLVVIAFVAMLAMMLGCSGGSPVGLDKEAGTLDSIPVIGLSEVGDTFNAVGLLGAYEIYINPESMSADLVAKRTSTAIGDSYVISGLPFFTMTPCADCVKLTGVALTSGGDAKLSFSIRHPFKMGSMSLPPTAGNRRDLDIFDVAAVIAPIAGTATEYTALGKIYDGVCVGPAGFTKELANLFTPVDTAAMPFFLVKDDSIDSTPPVSTYNKFAMGGTDNFDIVFNLDGGTLKFDMFLTFGYGAAAAGKDKPSFLAPKYFNPEFNRKNAWKVAVTPPAVTWLDNQPTVEKNVEVKVWDWQQGAVVSTAVPYSTETVKTKVFEASTVTKVQAEIFGDTGESLAPASGLGTPISPLVFQVPIANSLTRPAGTYMGLVKVFDSRTPAAAFTEGQDFLIDTPDGIALNNVLMTEFATYQTFQATIIVGCGPITLGTVTGCPVAPVVNDTNLNFTVTASSFNSTQIQYEIDSDYDGVTFSPDGPANLTGSFTGVNFNSSPCVIGDTFDVAVRMTDDCAPVNNVAVFTICTVEIGTCCGPINGSGRFITTPCPQNINTGNSIAFVVGGVVSPSATITYYADYSYDGITFNRDASTTTGTFAAYQFNTAGSYTVAFQAEDSCTPPGVYTFNITCTVNVVSPPLYVWDGDVNGATLTTCVYTSPGFSFISGINCYDENGSTTTAYPAYANTWIMTPDITFPASGTIRITFEHYGGAEGYYDGAVLGYTSDSGASWTLNNTATPWATYYTGYTPSTIDYWYGMYYSYGCGTPGIYSYSGWANRWYTGTASSWNVPSTRVSSTFTATGLNGLTCKIGLIFKADSSVQYSPGFGVNRIEINVV
jgi:hypothetical protein